MSKLGVALWNFENLFDHETAQRPEPLKKKLKRELNECSASVRDRKIAQVASVIGKMFAGQAPALLGVCEEENESVVDRLAKAINVPGRTSAVASHQSTDARGIDTSFIVDTSALQVLSTDHQVVLKSMGDFNDEPFNRSMQDYMLGTRDPGRARYSSSGHMLNLMWPLMQGDDPGTYLYGSTWNMLDQFLVSYGMLRGPSLVQVDRSSVAIFKPGEMVGSSGKPIAFRRPSAKTGANLNGYSDHFPITVELDVS
ncbi:MAG: hypothetical protein ACI9EF_001458 [Pseudohongiellaceae bacterium]|jgi:hypothetical protein